MITISHPWLVDISLTVFLILRLTRFLLTALPTLLPTEKPYLFTPRSLGRIPRTRRPLDQRLPSLSTAVMSRLLRSLWLFSIPLIGFPFL